MRTTASLLLVVGLSLSACNSEPEPADVPTPTDSLTTDTESETGPETQSPTSDDVSATSEPATSSPPADETTTTSPPDDEATTSQAAGIPELPHAATEDSEAGAEAFALHYIDLLNALSQQPEEGRLDVLASDNCATCGNFEASVNALESEGQRTTGPVAEVVDSQSVQMGDEAQVTISLSQLGPDTVDAGGAIVSEGSSPSGVSLVFSLVSTESGWSVGEIQVTGR